MSDWLAMGGYALYVWGSLLMVVLCVVVELLGLRARFRSLTLTKNRRGSTS